ncbi:MAG TPA: SRPBCC family protein [Actinomycetota bacterium]|nr:SRPBCC family protein [Actinomycetota bacterium]
MTDYIVVERRVQIDASTARIQSWIIDFHKWIGWSPWERIDPDLTRAYSGSDAGVGARYEWAGNRKAGAGHMAIESVSTDEVDIALTFTKPFKSDSRAQFSFQPGADQTTVTWKILTPKTFVLRIMSVFMKLDKSVGADLEAGLAQLKAVSESHD